MARKRKAASGNQTQPVADIPAARHGDAAELEAQQSGAPMQGPAPTAATTQTQQAAGGGGNPGPIFGPSAFRPTERPGEPIQSGIPFGPGGSGQNMAIPTDTVDDFLRAMYSQFPHPAILRLLKE